MKMGFLFTSESVSEGHPDKVSDQISDAILDEFLRRDANSKVACETLCTTGLVVVAGEVRSEAYVDVQGVARRVINRIGYTRSDYQFDGNSCGILSAIHEQSSDINQGVVREAEEEQGAGDQGIMFGYACNETREMMPATLILSHVILKELAVIRREGEVMTYLRPDSKSQVTIEYDETTNKPLRVHTIVVSTQHDEFILPGEGRSEKEAEKQMQDKIREDVRTILIPRVKARLERAGDQLAALIGDDYILHVNPTGKFVIGGPHGDTGTYGPQDHRRHLRRPRRARRRRLFGQGLVQSGPFGGLCRAPHRQEPRGGGRRRPDSGRVVATPSASRSRCRSTSIPTIHPVPRRWPA